jgi:hypothetical protein
LISVSNDSWNFLAAEFLVFVVFDFSAEGESAAFVDDGEALFFVEALGNFDFVLEVFDAVGVGDEGGDGEGNFDAVFEAVVAGYEGVGFLSVSLGF